MKQLIQLSRKNHLLRILMICSLGIFTCTAGLNAAADERHSGHGKKYGHDKHQYNHKYQNSHKHQRYDAHKSYRESHRYYRTPSHSSQGFSFNLWSFKPIVPSHNSYRSYSPGYHFHNSHQRCYSNHSQIIINTR